MIGKGEVWYKCVVGTWVLHRLLGDTETGRRGRIIVDLGTEHILFPSATDRVVFGDGD